MPAEHMNQINSYSKTLIYSPGAFPKSIKKKSLKNCCQEILETNCKKQNATSDHLGKAEAFKNYDDMFPSKVSI